MKVNVRPQERTLRFGQLKVGATFTRSGAYYVKISPVLVGQERENYNIDPETYVEPHHWAECNCFNLNTNRLGRYKNDTIVEAIALEVTNG